MSWVSAHDAIVLSAARSPTGSLPHDTDVPLRRTHVLASIASRAPISSWCTLITDPSSRYIKTAMTKVYTENAEYTKYIIDRTPAGRWGLPEDFRGAVIFLASRASDFCCGMPLVVDGGIIAK